MTSNRTALIEMVPDTLSLHQLKAKSPVGTSLADHFFAKFVKVNSPLFFGFNSLDDSNWVRTNIEDCSLLLCGEADQAFGPVIAPRGRFVLGILLEKSFCKGVSTQAPL